MEPLNRYQFFLNKNQAEVQSRTSPYCEFKLKQKLTLSSPDYIFQFSINRVSIPLSFYNFNNNNNRLKWTITAAIPVGLINLTSTITIPPGNYDLTQFIAALNAATLSSLQSQSGLFVAATWSFVYDPVTNKAGYKLATNIAICTIQFDDCTISRALGFDNSWSIVCNDPNFIYPLYTVNLYPISNVYVTSVGLNDNTSFEALGGTIDLSQVLATVPMDYLNIHYCSVEFNNPIKIRLTNDTINSLDFNLQDSEGNILACDQPWSLQLTIEEIPVPRVMAGPKNQAVSVEASSNTVDYSSPTLSVLSQLKDQLLTRAQGDLIEYVSKRRKT